MRDQMLRHLLTLNSRPLLPVRDGALVQLAGRHNRLDRAAVRQQGHDLHDQRRGMVQAIERGALGGREGLPALDAEIALLFLAVDANIAFGGLPFGRATLVRAECCLSLHVLVAVLVLLA